jgi:glycerol-3-phosphate dehydrogenase
MYLDAAAAADAAPRVADLLAKELGKGEDWAADQVRSFTAAVRAAVP